MTATALDDAPALEDDAAARPLRPGILCAIMVTNVLRHISDVSRFFADAAEVVRTEPRSS